MQRWARQRTEMVWMDVKEAEDIKKRWQEYTELYKKKIFMTQITTMVLSLTQSETSWNATSSQAKEHHYEQS